MPPVNAAYVHIMANGVNNAYSGWLSGERRIWMKSMMALRRMARMAGKRNRMLWRHPVQV